MMASGNIQILYLNWLDANATTLSASSEVTPVQRVREPDLGRLWTTAGCADEWMVADFGDVRPITHAASVRHSADTNGRVAFQLSNDAAFATLLYDLEQDARPPIVGFGDDPFGESLGGYHRPGVDPPYRGCLVWDLGGRVYARYARFRFRNPTNPAGRLEIPRLFAGVAFQPRRNFQKNWKIGFVDPSMEVETDGGVPYWLTKSQYRRLTLELPALDEDEALTFFSDLLARIGKTRDLVVVSFPQASIPKRHATTLYGRIKDDVDLENPYGAVYGTSLTVHEIVP